MKPLQIAQWRMHNTGLWTSHSKSAPEVVARLGAMQAQEFPYAKWSIAQRVEGVHDPEVTKLFDDGAFLRTHVLRPTWHFVAPEDIRWMLSLTAPRVKSMQASSNRKLGLDDRTIARTNGVIEKALSGGKHETRKDLIEVLKRAKITGDSQRFGHIFGRAELDGLICSGAMQGKQQTYALLEERVPVGLALEGDEALTELARRYFTTRGPSTVKDFSWWSSLKMADCRRALEILGDELESKEIGDRVYWFERGSTPPRLRKGTIDLVQVYDEMVVSYTVSRDALTQTVEGNIPRDIMFFWHPMLMDGQVIGHWRRRSQAKVTRVEVFFYRELSKKETRAFDSAVEAYRNFTGEPIELSLQRAP